MRKRSGELQKVGSLFDIYKDKLRAPQKSVIDVVVVVIGEVTGIILDPNRCTYTVRSRTLATNAASLIKHEISRKEQEILSHCQDRLGKESAPLRII
ncbi:MAG: hypothetical protein RLZZ70_233 [Candidatus Parcubacteria bacterium]|jgi:hypothetical protein